MADKTAGRMRPGAMAFVLLTVALSWSIWIGTWLATGRPNTFHGPGAMMAAIYAGSFGPGVAAAILSAISRPGSLKEWLRGFIRFAVDARLCRRAAAIPVGAARSDDCPRLCPKA